MSTAYINFVETIRFTLIKQSCLTQYVPQNKDYAIPASFMQRKDFGATLQPM